MRNIIALLLLINCQIFFGRLELMNLVLKKAIQMNTEDVDWIEITNIGSSTES